MVFLDFTSGLVIMICALLINRGNDLTVICVSLVLLSILGAFESPTVQACVAFLFPASAIFHYIVLLIFFAVIQVIASLFSVFGLSIIQQLTPQNMAGKVMSFVATITLCSQPISQILYGIPSQLLQIFCLSTPDEDYFEAFLGLFASAHIGFGSNQLNNEQVQQIMGRVAYYSERPDFAKRVLCNQLIQQKFAEQETEEEQAAIVDDAIREEIEKLEAENERIANDAQQFQVEIGELRDELSRSQAEKDNQREANEQLIADLKKEFERQHTESLKEIAGLKADKATQDRIIAQGEQTQADTKRRLSEYEHRVDTLQQFYDDVQRKKKRDRLIVWGIVFVLAALGIMVAAVIVILSVLVLIPWSAQFAMTLLSSLAEFCGIQNESVMSFAGYASGVISAVPLPFLIWLAKTAWKKIKGNVDILLSVDSK